ncbi:MAG TPA: hypothetical protein VJ794_06305 [Gemmatimonadales bacterium]|nr:hypothetical protein [Gemmatimonadales bacterium]
MSRREAILSAALVFVIALVVRAWAASQITFPRPEDVAYYVGVARNLVEGRGLVTDAIWSFQTPPLSFPRPAFEVWLPLPSLLAAVPMLFLGTTFAAAQVSSVLVGSLVCVLAWRLAADVAASRQMPVGRARTFAVGVGLTCAVYLPLVLASAQPDSTMPFAFVSLLACLLMARIERTGAHLADVLLLGLLFGLAALTRNEAVWLALTWAIVALALARRHALEPVLEPTPEPRFWHTRSDRRFGRWFLLVAPAAIVAMVVCGPWAYRDWLVFGSPFPGQALTNALSLDGRDIFAWQVEPTVGRYLAAGLPVLLELRWTGFVHNVMNVLVYLGIPLSVVSVLGLPRVFRGARSPVEPLRPLVLFSVLTFLVACLVFPVSTTWGTFLHAAGAIHVLLVISALLFLDRLIGWVGRRRGWTRPVAWLGPAFAIAGCLLFSSVLLVSDGGAARETRVRYEALAWALESGGTGFVLSEEPGPVITDFPIWLAEATRHTTLALPNEPVESVLSLAGAFDPPARLLVVGAGNEGIWPAAILSGGPGSECFVPLELPEYPEHPGALEDILAFRIRCL